jgi:hypothetical protein
MSRNIDTQGRIIRGLSAAAMIGAAVAGLFLSWPAWVVVLLVAAGAFTAFEAIRGWCALRACGIKTRF